MKILSLLVAAILMTGRFAIAHERLGFKKAWDCKAFLVAGNKIDDSNLVSDPQLTNLVKNLYAGSFDINLAVGPMQEKYYDRILTAFAGARTKSHGLPLLSAEDGVLLTAWLQEDPELLKLNQKLREGSTLSDAEDEQLWKLLSAVEKTESFHSLSFRGMSLPAGAFTALFKSRRHYVDNGFSAASLSPAKISSYLNRQAENAVMILKSNSGHYISDAALDSSLRSRHEIVFKPGTAWKILKLVESRDTGRMPHLVFLEEE